MSNAATDQGEEIQNDADALASAMAGYNHTARGEQPPADVIAEPSAELEDDPVIEDQLPEPEAQPSVADELAALKAKVRAMTGDTDAVRRLHGEIGDINRTLKQMQTPAAPVEDDLTAALRDAEAAAVDFPEVVGPLVKALKMSLSRQTPTQSAPEDIDGRISNEVARIRQKEAIETLSEEHPDYETVRETNEYKTWLASKTPEFQERFTTTWNPAVVAKGLTEFKDSLKTKQRKQDRLAAAVTPQGVPQKAGPSTLPDEAGFAVGYNKGRKRL